MLPYFKTLTEISQVIEYVDGRAKIMLLLETPEAVEILDALLELRGIDAIHIGLNDLSLGYGKKFMFELLADGTIERICTKIREKNIPYGFGGIASIGRGELPAEMIVKEHYRLGSSCVILSRAFCSADQINHLGVISSIFVKGISEIRELETECERHMRYFTDNKCELQSVVKKIVERRR